MCNFVEGEVLAFGPISDLLELDGDLPGSLSVEPLISEVGEIPPESPLVGIGVATLRTSPGLELYGLSQMSARLSPLVRKEKAIVELNHYLPMGSVPAEGQVRLSAHAEQVVASLRSSLRHPLSRYIVDEGDPPLTVGILDSGLLASATPHRNLSYFDYSNGGRLTLHAPRADPLGHGTRVAKILDEVLPPDVEFAVGRLPEEGRGLTSLMVANALGDLVARATPDVVNLSIAPRDDTPKCRTCGKRLALPTFLPTFFSLIMRLVSRSQRRTVTVLAAGNSGQVSNSRWLSPDLDSMIIATANNRKGYRANYSGSPEGPLADLYSAGAFGGDDPEDDDAMGAFLDGAHGTSFAAPLVTAAALAAKVERDRGGNQSPLAPNVRRLLTEAHGFSRHVLLLRDHN